MLDLKLKQFASYQQLVGLIEEKLIQPAVVKTREEQLQFEQKDRLKRLGLSFYQLEQIMSYRKAMEEQLPGGAKKQKEEKKPVKLARRTAAYDGAQRFI